MSFAPPPVWSPPADSPVAPGRRRRVRFVLAVVCLVLFAGTTVVLLGVLRHDQAELATARSELVNARSQLQESKASIEDVRHQLASAQEDNQNLQAQLDRAPNANNCAAVRFGGSWSSTEQIVVICGPHAADARDALVEYRVSHDDVSSYLQNHHPLNAVFLDLSFDTSS
jgi:hypothetical protein